MAYDEGMAQRVREILEEQSGIIEKRMFGGLAFMINGNMAVGIVKSDLMVRVGPGNYNEALTESGAREMDFTGKPLKGFVYVDADVLESDETLSTWIRRGRDFSFSLPSK